MNTSSRYFVLIALLILFVSGCDNSRSTAKPYNSLKPVSVKRSVSARDSIPEINIGNGILYISLSPNREFLALIADYENEDVLQVFSLKDKKIVNKISVGEILPIWSPDSKYIFANRTIVKRVKKPDTFGMLTENGFEYSYSIIVTKIGGESKSYTSQNAVQSISLRKNDPSKILYAIQEESAKYLIYEINNKTKTTAKLRTSTKYFAGLSQFRGQDCYSEYDYKPCDLGMLRVRDIDTDKVLLRCDLAGLDADEVKVDFSPDSKWMSVMWGISGNSIIAVGSVQDSLRFMRDRYITAYQNSVNVSSIRIAWLPDWIKHTKKEVYAIASTSRDYTIVDLAYGYEYGEREGNACWWTNPEGEMMGIIADGDKLRTQYMYEYDIMAPEGRVKDPYLVTIATLKRQTADPYKK